MGTTLQGDASIGIKAESTYGTPVTVTAHYEFLSETFQKNINFVQGMGLRAGKVTDRYDRRVGGKIEAVGDIVVEGLDKDLPQFLGWWLGSKTDGGAGPFFHLMKPATVDVPPSNTIQVGLPLRDGGAVQPFTYQGMCVTTGTLTVSADQPVQLTTSWTGQDCLTATGFVTPVYTASQTVFSFHQATSLAIGGAVTQPIISAVGSGGTAATNIRDFSFTWDNGLDANGWNLGGNGKRTRSPAYGVRHGSGTLTAEFDATTLRDLYLAGTSAPLLLTVTAANGSILQVSIPAVTFEPGSFPQSQAGDVITASMPFTVKDDGTNSPVIMLVKNGQAT